MDESQYKERVKRLRAVNGVVSKLDAAIRAEAFALLKGYITGGGTTTTTKASGRGSTTDTSDLSFFTKFDHDKPAGNVLLIAAYLFGQYGSTPFSLDDVKSLADTAGLTIPSRIDMTLKGSRRNGKSLFTGAGRGKYRPTVHGEKALKEAYGVKKGTKAKPE